MLTVNNNVLRVKKTITVASYILHDTKVGAKRIGVKRLKFSRDIYYDTQLNAF